MATIVVKVTKVSVDAIQRPLLRGQDIGNNQFHTVYGRKDLGNLFTGVAVGDVVTIEGTLHAVRGDSVDSDWVKTIATSVS
jgi:hypothetical protein